MKKFTAILLFMLMSYPVYAREGRNQNRMISTFLAAASSSKNASDTEGNEGNDQGMESDTETEGMGTNGTDSDHEGSDTQSDGENEADDMNGETNSAKKAIRDSLKASVMKQSQSALGQMAAAPDAMLDPLRSISELLSPAATNGGALSTIGNQVNLLESSSVVAGGSVMPMSAASLVTNTSIASGQLTTSTAPEPSAWILAAISILAPLFMRRR